MNVPPVQWTAPAPLWPQLSVNGNGRSADFQRPHILRFANDDFMESYIRLVAQEPERLGKWEATAETWRGPQTEPIPVASLPDFAQRLYRLRLGLAALAGGAQTESPIQDGMIIPSSNLKLYQAAHQRHYLVSASFVCRRPGLPDRLFDNNRGEQATYVIRRLVPRTDGVEPMVDSAQQIDNLHEFDEYAFVLTPAQKEWHYLGEVGTAATQTLAFGEEQLPLFGVTYQEETGFSRRLLSGVIPVGKRESYVGAAVISETNDGANEPPDPRSSLFRTLVVQPWQSINGLEAKTNARLAVGEASLRVELSKEGEDTDDIEDAVDKYWEDIETQAQITGTAEQIQIGSWYTLLEFADFLEKYLSDVWKVVSGEELSSSLPGGSAASVLWQTLNSNSFTDVSGDRLTLAEALAAIASEENRQLLEGTARTYRSDETSFWPTVHFPLTAVSHLVTPPAPALPTIPPADSLLEAQVKNALMAAEAPADTPPRSLAATQSAVDMSAPAWYIIRCVFERPNCIEYQPIVLSEPTRPFQLAGFFDPDAPARPIRIALPTDTSPDGLRKFNKNTAFVISDILACQMERAGNLTLGDLVLSVLPWPFHKSLPDPNAGSCTEGDGLSFGLICSLSIPIITICALILLMIMVTLLDQIFRWIPYFIACFPLPSLKGNKS